MYAVYNFKIIIRTRLSLKHLLFWAELCNLIDCIIHVCVCMCRGIPRHFFGSTHKVRLKLSLPKVRNIFFYFNRILVLTYKLRPSALSSNVWIFVWIQLHALQLVCGTSDGIIALSSNVWLWMQESTTSFWQLWHCDNDISWCLFHSSLFCIVIVFMFSYF